MAFTRITLSFQPRLRLRRRSHQATLAADKTFVVSATITSTTAFKLLSAAKKAAVCGTGREGETVQYLSILTGKTLQGCTLSVYFLLEFLLVARDRG